MTHQTDVRILPERFEGEELSSYVKRLKDALADVLDDVYKDTRYGAATHRVLSSVPGTSNLEEGALVFFESGGVRKLYTKLNGVVREVTLT